MQKLSEIARAEGFEPTEKTCACGAVFATYVTLVTACPDCCEAARVEALGEYKIRAGSRVAVLVTRRLKELGLSTAEREADPSRVPREIRRRLPKEAVEYLAAGKRTVGFGLSGGQGVGKTMALAALLREALTSLTRRNLEGLQALPSKGAENERWWATGRLRWASWPERSAWMKGRVAYDAHREVEEWIVRSCETPLLVLDDLGRERLKGSYQEDYAAGHLDRIIDIRSRERLPIWWTSNLAPEELMAFYGSAMVSRLIGLAPATELPALRDLRLSPLAAVAS